MRRVELPIHGLLMVLVGCAEVRSPPVKYPDTCGSAVECFTRGLEKLDDAYKRLAEAEALALRSVPVGSVVAYAGSEEPDGWLVCDGRSLDKNDARYRSLFDMLGVSHGGDASPTFQIPDYRGMFLRGVSGPSGRDPDADQRTTPGRNGSGNAGNKVGSVQSDALQSHRHDVTFSFHATGSNGTHDVKGGGDKFNSDPPSAGFGVNILDPTGARTAKETRPANAAVNWIIRYR